jgi:hypothetical protein
MRFRFPRPLHGWREFIHEIVIVVIGVLLALGGAELIDNLRWKSEVASFRDAIDHELGRDLEIHRRVLAQRPCADRRLAELERFLADASAGRRDKLLRPVGKPYLQTLFFSVWDNKGGEVIDHLPLNERTRYGELYDELRNDEKVLLNERDVWRGMAIAEQSEPLDHADRVRMRELLTRAEQFNEVARPNYEYALKLAEALRIRPIPETNIETVKSDDSFCQPLFAK